MLPLWAAFAQIGKVGSEPGADPQLRLRTFNTLATAFLPLVPSLRFAKDCIIPLWAAAKLGCWHHDLATALLKRLCATSSARSDGATQVRQPQPAVPPVLQPPLLEGANGQGHGNLWWAMSEAPPDIAALAEEALQISAACLLKIPCEQLTAQHCANILLACQKLGRGSEGPVVHRVTACLAAKPDADCQALANALFALGDLAKGCGHAPRLGDLRRLSERIVQRLRAGAGAIEGLPRYPLARQPELPHEDGQQETEAAPRLRPEANGSGRVGPAAWSVGGGAGARRPAERLGFSGQELSSMLLACANLPDSVPMALPPALAAAAASAAAAGRMNAQALSNSLYSLATMGFVGAAAASTATATGTTAAAASAVMYDSVLGALCAATLRRLHERPDEFVSQNIANALWALSRLQLRPPGRAMVLAADLAAEYGRRGFEGANAEDLTISLWAQARMGWADQGWYAAAAAAAGRPGVMAGAAATRWARLWAALAIVRHRPDDNLMALMLTGRPPAALDSQAQSGALTTARRELAAAAAGFTRGASAGACVRLLWAQAVLGCPRRPLVGALAAQLGGLLQLNPAWLSDAAVADGLWALAVLGGDALRRHCVLVEALLHEAVWRWEESGRRHGSGRRAMGSPRVLVQLWQVQLELQNLDDDAVGDAGGNNGGENGDGEAAERSAGGPRNDPAQRGERGDRPLEAGSESRALRPSGVGSRLSRILGGSPSLLDGALRAAAAAALPRAPGGPALHADLLHVAPESEVEMQRQVVASLVQLQERLAAAAAQDQQPGGDAGSSSAGGRGLGSGEAVGAMEGMRGSSSVGPILTVQPNHVVPEVFRRVDVLVRLWGRRSVIVMVDGPGCFLANEPYACTETGQTRLRNRQLERVCGEGGVVSVPYWEWEALRDGQERRLYLCDLLGLKLPRRRRI